jgi:hypothetical protein
MFILCLRECIEDGVEGTLEYSRNGMLVGQLSHVPGIDQNVIPGVVFLFVRISKPNAKKDLSSITKIAIRSTPGAVKARANNHQGVDGRRLKRNEGFRERERVSLKQAMCV